MRPRRHQRRRQAKQHTGKKRKHERKPDHQRRRRSVHRHVLLIGKRQRQQRVSSHVGDRQAQQPARARQQHALRKQLAHNPASRRAQRRANRELRPPSHPAHQQQVGNVGAGHQQHHRGNPLQQLQVVLIPVLHVLDAAAARTQHHVRPWQHLLRARIGKGLQRRKLLLQQSARLRLQPWQRSSRLDAADNVGPLRVRFVKVRRAAHRVHRIHGQKIFRRVGVDAVAIKPFRRNPNQRGRLGIDVKRAPHNLGIARVILLPRVVAHHRGQRRALLVVRIHKQPPRRRRKTKHPKIVAGNKRRRH